MKLMNRLVFSRFIVLMAKEFMSGAVLKKQTAQRSMVNTMRIIMVSEVNAAFKAIAMLFMHVSVQVMMPNLDLQSWSIWEQSLLLGYCQETCDNDKLFMLRLERNF